MRTTALLPTRHVLMWPGGGTEKHHFGFRRSDTLGYHGSCGRALPVARASWGDGPGGGAGELGAVRAGTTCFRCCSALPSTYQNIVGMKHLPPLRTPRLVPAHSSKKGIVSVIRLLLIMLPIFLMNAPSEAKAQSITIYNLTGQDFALNFYYAATCTPPGTQQLACIPLANGTSYVYTPPSGSIWYGFKIYCGTDCSFPLVGSTSCSGGRPFDCGGVTFYTSVGTNEVRIYE
jgi:hypothetical protein